MVPYWYKCTRPNPNTPDKLAISVIGDPTWWADNGSEISERYGAWMGN